MSTITRAFTKRNKRPEVSAPMPYRGEGHVRFNSGTIKRGNISGPVQLLSTTNMLAYNAPDLNAHTPSSTSSVQSQEDSDVAISPQSYSSSLTNITTPDISPHDSSPVDSNPHPKRSATVTSHPRSSTTSSSSNDAPMVPKRAPTHTKRSHQELSRKRSQRMSPPPSEPPRSTPTVRASQDMFKSEAHPFSKELEQVNEVAEEFGNLQVMDEEERILYRKGLKKFTVDDYLSEIEELYGSIFDDKLGPLGTGAWL